MSDKLTGDLISLIFNTGQVLREKNKEKTCSFLHMQTLRYIKEQKEVAMKELANYLHITPPSATSLVNSLAAEGLVERIEDEADRRAVQLKITAAGQELLTNNFQKAARTMEEYLNRLTEEEKKNFITILNKFSS